MWLLQAVFVWSIFPLASQYRNIISVNREGGVVLKGKGLIDMNNLTQTELVLTTMFDMCEYYSTCNKTVPVPSDVQKFIGCCVPCDCSDDCFAVGNCCKDKTGEPPRDERYTTARGESCEITNTTAMGRVKVNTNRKLLVSGCHPNYTGDAAIKCVTPRHAQLPPDLFIPVYSKLTNLSYANVYCAICNFQHVAASQGTSELVPWEATADCSEYGTLRKRNGTGSPTLHTNCKYNVLPAGLPIQDCYNLPEPLDCSGTADPKECNMYPGHYGKFVAMRNRICTNSCSLPRNIGICSIQYSWYSYWVLLNLDIESHISFDSNDDSDQRTFASRRADKGVDKLPDGCRTGHVKSPDGSCVSLACSPSQYKAEVDDFRCVDIYGQVKGACLEYRLIFHQSMITSRLDAYWFMNMDELSANLFPDRPKDTTFVLSDYEVNNYNSTVLAQKVTFFEVQLRFIDVKELFMAFKERLKTAFPGDSVQVELMERGVAYQTLSIDEVGYLSYANQTNTPRVGCQTAIAMSDLQFCQMLTFPPRQYRILDGVVVLSDGRQFRPHEYVLRQALGGGTHAQVCMDTYMAMGGTAGSANLAAATRLNVAGVVLLLGCMSVC